MFAPRRDFLYKRSHKGAHLGLAARGASSTLTSLGLEKVANTSPATSADPQTTAITPLTPVAPVSQTTTTSSSTASSLSTPGSSSSSSLSPTSTSSSASKSSSATSTAPSTASNPLTVASPTTAHAPSVTTQVVPGVSFTASSTLSPTTTSSADSSSGPSTSTIVGGVAGALAGIAVLGFLLMWCMRRQRNRDIDDFDAQAFKRQSAILVDDPVEPSRSYNPRPPTMIERHNASPALAAQAGHGVQNFYGNYGGYDQQPLYAPPEMIQPTGSPPPQAYGAPPMGYAGYNDPRQRIARQPSDVGHAAYDSQQQLARQPSNAGYLTRQPSSPAGYPPPTAPPGSFDPNAQYIDLDRSSISPYQAAQYADISRQLGTTDSNAEVPHESLQLPDGPLPSPFDDPVEATLVPNASPYTRQDHSSNVTAPGPVTVARAPQTQGNAIEPHHRPATVYEEGDAYGGI